MYLAKYPIFRVLLSEKATVRNSRKVLASSYGPRSARTRCWTFWLLVSMVSSAGTVWISMFFLTSKAY